MHLIFAQDILPVLSKALSVLDTPAIPTQVDVTSNNIMSLTTAENGNEGEWATFPARNKISQKDTSDAATQT